MLLPAVQAQTRNDSLTKDETMARPTVLWCNLMRSQRPPALIQTLGTHCDIHWLPGAEELDSRLRSLQPQILCLDYDYPTPEGLGVLRQVKQNYPAIAILMLTEYHSESLAVWAFRERVWDYLMKPVGEEELHSRIATIYQIHTNCMDGGVRELMQAVPGETETTVQRLRPGAGQKLVLMAKAYVQNHLSEDFDARAVARHCCTSYFHFSRTFKQVYGETFSEFLQKSRISAAAKLLAGGGSNVTRACYDAGFRDVSYFSQVFRKYLGVSPSKYRERQGREREVREAG